MTLRRLAPGLVFLVAVFAFANSLPGTFLGDDDYIIARNPLVLNFDVVKIFSTDYWQGALGLEPSGLHRPIPVLTYALNHHLTGAGAFGYRITNILLHGGVSLLFFAFANLLGVGLPAALGAALLFAVHPVHCEVIGSLVGRAEILAALFIFFALWADAAEKPWSRRAVGGSLVLALLSKESGVALLPLLILSDWMRHSDPAARLRKNWRYWLALGGVILIWWWWRRAYLPPSTAAIYPGDNPLAYADPFTRAAGAVAVQGGALLKLLWPLNYHYLYSWNDFWLPQGTLGSAAVLLAGLSLLLLILRLLLKREAEGFAAAFYLVSAATTANLFFPIAVHYAERLQYLPSAGFCLLFALLAAKLKRPGVALMAAALLLSLGVTLYRNTLFKDPLELYRVAASASPLNPRAHNALAVEYDKAGRFAEAEAEYIKSAEVAPAFTDAYATVAQFYLTMGQPAKALVWVEKGLKIEEHRALYSLAARALAELGQVGEAEKLLDGPLLNLLEPNAVYARGISLEKRGNLSYSLDHYAFTQARKPSPESTRRFANLLLRSGQRQKAIEVLEEGVRRWPSDGILRELRGNVLR